MTLRSVDFVNSINSLIPPAHDYLAFDGPGVNPTKERRCVGAAQRTGPRKPAE